MKRLQAIISRLSPLVWAYLALLTLTILCSAALSWKPVGPSAIRDHKGKANLSFAVDHLVTVWPFDCVRVTWSVDHISAIYLNGASAVGTGDQVTCGDNPPAFRVEFPDQPAQRYVLGRFALSERYVLASLILPLALTALLAMGYRRRLAATWWIYLGFFISFLVFFLLPIFLLPAQMQFPQYIPTFPITGFDLKQTLDYSGSWLLHHGTPYTGTNNYPPLSTLLFAPLLFIPFHTAYILLTTATLLCFLGIALFFPMILGHKRNLSSTLAVFLLTGLISYGFQFEVERGQFNVIVVGLCFIAIYLYHYHPKLRYVGYALFTIAVQIKLYPLIFIIFFVKDWSAWKDNIRRFVLIGAVNIACLFVLGLGIFNDFLTASFHINNQDYPLIWVGSGSITTFALLLPKLGLDFPGAATIVQASLFLVFAVCFGLVWWRVYRRGSASVDPYLLMVCLIGAMIIPALSNDYKTPILIPGMVILLESLEPPPEDFRLWVWQMVLIFILSTAYAFTLYSFVVKTGILVNNLPVYIVMLIATTLLALIPRSSRLETDPYEESHLV